MKEQKYYYDHLRNINKTLSAKRSIHGAHHRNLNRDIQTAVLAQPSGSKVLDVGCGLSVWVTVKIDKSFEMYGLDEQQDAIDFCKENFPGRTYSTGSVYALPYQDDYFDVIVMREVIEHLHEPERAMLEVRRCLKPGGILCLTTPNYDSILLMIIENTYNRFFGGECKPYLDSVHPSKFHFYELGDLLDRHFEKQYLRRISLGISLSALYRKKCA